MQSDETAQKSPNMTADYEFELPKSLVAQEPLARRDDARLLVIDRETKEITHWHVRDLPELLRAGDLLVLNDTRVLPAQLVGFREATRGRWEGLFLEADSNGVWKLLAKTRGKIRPGEWVVLQDRSGAERLRMQLLAKLNGGSWAAKPHSDLPTFQILESIGRVPLPRYIRDGKMVDADTKDYQTIFATKPGSVAAPTAGLHFTKSLFENLIERDIAITRLTLHVGVGTFKPVVAESLDEHKMHAEWTCIDERAANEITRCRDRGGRVIAVGTTTVRALETAARVSQPIQPWEGTTDLFIRPPFEFKAIDGMMTNFHLPRSTLLVLVRTFGGAELIKRAYSIAIEEKYRFFSYGDAMLIL